VEIEASAPRRRPILSRTIRSDSLTLVLLQAACVLVVAGWIALIVYLAWTLQ